MSEKKLISTHEFQIRWVDLDAYNHLNNAKYYDFMSECRCIDFLKFNNDCGFIVSENSCKYKSPVGYPTKFIIEQYVQNISTVSFELIYIFRTTTSEKVVAEGYAKMVCFDLNKNRPVKIPQKLSEIFAGL